ncbi:unnamed protein product [Rhizoctonia solani]|nr:unnamed protein product [Rhizoctonia solani]
MLDPNAYRVGLNTTIVSFMDIDQQAAEVTSSYASAFFQPSVQFQFFFFCFTTSLVTGSLAYRQRLSSSQTLLNVHITMLAKTSAFSSALLVLAAVTSVNAHAAMIKVGATGKGFGVVETTPRDGTRRDPFQADTSIIRDADAANGAAGACGRTLAGGPIDAAAEMEAASAAGLPAVAADGTITMVMHQVNGDGAGPYTCGVSADASAQNFVDMKIITNVPGQNSRSNAKAQDFPLVAQMPAGTACTGGPNGDACIIRCRNAARAGPFGACAAGKTNTGGVTIAEAEKALAQDISKRAVVKSFEKKRVIRSRIAGAKAGYWI